MAAQEPGGRGKAIGGVTLSDRERALIDRARKQMHPPMSRADFLREGALRLAVEVAEEQGFELIPPEESRGNPELWELYLRYRAELARRQVTSRRPTSK